MTAEHYDGADWPHTITVGEGWYGLRIETDHGSVVHYIHAAPGSSAAEQRHDTPKAAGSTPALGTVAAAAGRAVVGLTNPVGPAHRGATCEAA